MEKCRQYDNKIILRRSEEHEIRGGKRGLIFCRNCNAVYHKKSWRHNLLSYKNLSENLSVKFLICPACRMIKNKQFEGEVIIEKAPEKIYQDLLNLIELFGHRAYQRDSQHRLIIAKKTDSQIVATTTENQLAVKLAKKIKETFKKAELNITYSSAPSDVTYVKLVFNS